MKKILAILVFVLIGTMSYAQYWSPNGTHIYNTNTGYVGIGTGTSFTPTENLHIRNLGAAVNLALESSYTGAGSQVIGRFRIRNSGNGDLYYIGLRVTSGTREAIQSVYSGLTSTWLEFAYINIDTRKYELRAGLNDVQFLNTGKISFDNTGAIGIHMGATAIPAGTLLAVAGKVSCKEVEVTLTGLPDYVFNKDYKLRSLYDVESFVNENKHLPDVPSESEVVKNGLNLGDMNSTLLKKVEELTLYMINLQKESDALKARISKLEK